MHTKLIFIRISFLHTHENSLYILQNLEYRTIKEPNMVQKRMTRSLILLSFVLDVRRVEGHAHYSYPRHHSRNSQMCFRTLEWKKSNCEAMKEGDSQVSVLEFYAACLVSATLAKYESLLEESLQKIELSYIFLMLFFASARFCQFFILYRVILGGKAWKSRWKKTWPFPQWCTV